MMISKAYRWGIFASTIGLILYLSAFAPPQAPPLVTLYRTGQTPIPPYEHHPAIRYIQEYPVRDQIQLSPYQSDSLFRLLTHPDILIQGYTKSCIFQPSWMLQYGEDHAPKMQVLLSPSPCSKAIVITPDTTAWVVVAANSDLERYIKACGG